MTHSLLPTDRLMAAAAAATVMTAATPETELVELAAHVTRIETELILPLKKKIADLEERIVVLENRHWPANSHKRRAPASESSATVETETAADILAGPVIIYTDGSCLSNGTEGARAGSAVVALDGFAWSERNIGDQTNNRAELTAVIVGVAYARHYKTATIHSDSEYVVRGINDPTRLIYWAGHMWRKKGGGPVANSDLWKIMYALLAERSERRLFDDIKFFYVAAHSGIPGNEQCDKLAREVAIKTPPATAKAAWPECQTGLSWEKLQALANLF